MEMFTNKQRKRFPLQKINNNGGIFEIRKCKCNCAGDLEDGNDIMYIGAKKDDNGFMKMVAREEKLVTKGNCLVFIGDGQGSVGYSNYMDRDFIGSTTLSVGYNKNLNANIGMFFVTLLDLERRKYSYGRKYGTNLGKSEIKLPIDNNGDPDREFMENYVKSLHYKSITTTNKPSKHKLETDYRKEFKITSLFTIERGNITSLNYIEKGDVPIVSASGENEGIAFYSSLPPKYTNKITVSMNGVNTGFASYHGYGFNINVDACVLKEKFEMNKYVGIFLATIINNLRYRYSYGRKMSAERLQQEVIKLPVDDSGNPDREFMENYIKSLPYGDRI